MQKFMKSRLMRSIIPYFLLGVFLIVAFMVITRVTFFTTHLARFWGVVTPFIIGGVIAYILNMPCTGIQRLFLKIKYGFFQRRSRALAVVTLLVVVVALLVFIVSMIAPAVSASVSTFIEEVETYEEIFLGWVATIESWNLPAFLPSINEDLIFGIVSDFLYGLEMDGFASSVAAGFGTAFGVIFTMALAIVSAIYFLVEKDRLKAFSKRLVAAIFSSKSYDNILKYSQKLNHNFHMYIYTQTIDGVILGSLMTGLLLIFRSPHALLLGIILGVVNYIPYFGSIFGTIFAVIVVAFTQDIRTAAVAAIFMFIIQQLDGNFIQPRLMGGSFSLSPLLVIISVTIGMAYAGIIGMLIAIPIVAILKDLLDEFMEYREEKKRNPPPPTEEEYYGQLF